MHACIKVIKRCIKPLGIARGSDKGSGKPWVENDSKRRGQTGKDETKRS